MDLFDDTAAILNSVIYIMVYLGGKYILIYPP